MVDTRREAPDLPDYKLRKTPDEPGQLPPPRRPVGPWIAGIALVAATAVALYVVFGSRQTSAPVAPEPERVEAPQPPAEPLGGDAEPLVLPPLNQSDPLVRDLLKALTAHPRVAAWLATDGLIRNFTAVVANIAEGKTPAAQLRVLRPSSAFLVTERGSDMNVDPRSYERYDGLSAAVASTEPAGAARLYATLKPRIEEAYADLGVPGTPFDRTLERAIVLLLETPVLDEAGRLRVVHRGIVYGFADPDLEELTAAQKQLLRMGPRNVRIIQSQLRAIALALGIPAERLPVPRT